MLSTLNVTNRFHRVLEDLVRRCRSYSDHYPELWSARVLPNSNDNWLPESSMPGGRGAKVGCTAYDAIVRHRDPKYSKYDEISRGDWDTPGGIEVYHVVYGDKQGEEGWKRFSALTHELLEELCRFPGQLPINVDLWDSETRWLEPVHLLAQQPESPIRVQHYHCIRWRNKSGEVLNTHFPLASPTIERQLQSLGKEGDSIWELKYSELETNIWRATADAIDFLLFKSQDEKIKKEKPFEDRGSNAPVRFDFLHPNTLVWKNVTYQCKLTEMEVKFLNLFCATEKDTINVRELMSRSKAAIWRETYAYEPKKRNKISQLTFRVNDKLAKAKSLNNAEPKICASFSLRRGEPYVDLLEQ